MRMPFKILILSITLLFSVWGCSITIEKGSGRKGDLKGQESKGGYAKAAGGHGAGLAPVAGRQIKAGKDPYSQTYKPEAGKDDGKDKEEGVEKQYITAFLLKGLKTGVHLYSWLPGAGP